MTTSQFRPPSPLDPTVLIDSADHAVNNALPGGPSREVIHRAISTAYYAVFHAVNASNADIQHGAPTNAVTAQAWTNTYRQMRHGFANRKSRPTPVLPDPPCAKLGQPLHEPEDRSRNRGLRPQSDTDRRGRELLDRRGQGRSERPGSHDCGRPSNLQQHHPDGKPVISQQVTPSRTTERRLSLRP